jgi:MerR family redox-sensitive transcriptional activator SoxR
MAQLSISQVARQVGLRPSAIRYYEEIGVMPRARRESGQRRYDQSAVHRLAVVRRAQEVGFSLDEVRQLFFGFRPATPASVRWKNIADRKLQELDAAMERIRVMKELLQRLQTRCVCGTVEQCGAAILRRGFPLPPPTVRSRRHTSLPALNSD